MSCFCDTHEAWPIQICHLIGGARRSVATSPPWRFHKLTSETFLVASLDRSKLLCLRLPEVELHWAAIANYSLQVLPVVLVDEALRFEHGSCLVSVRARVLIIETVAYELSRVKARIEERSSVLCHTLRVDSVLLSVIEPRLLQGRLVDVKVGEHLWHNLPPQLARKAEAGDVLLAEESLDSRAVVCPLGPRSLDDDGDDIVPFEVVHSVRDG